MLLSFPAHLIDKSQRQPLLKLALLRGVEGITMLIGHHHIISIHEMHFNLTFYQSLLLPRAS